MLLNFHRRWTISVTLKNKNKKGKNVSFPSYIYNHSLQQNIWSSIVCRCLMLGLFCVLCRKVKARSRLTSRVCPKRAKEQQSGASSNSRDSSSLHIHDESAEGAAGRHARTDDFSSPRQISSKPTEGREGGGAEAARTTCWRPQKGWT